MLIPGAKAPKLVTNDLVARMKPGSVLVDIAIDQGGCFEDSRPTTHADPTFRGARLGLLLRREHAGRGAAHLDLRADQRHAALRRRARRPRLAGRAARPTRRSPCGLNTHDGQLTNAPVAEAHGYESVTVADALCLRQRHIQNGAGNPPAHRSPPKTGRPQGGHESRGPEGSFHAHRAFRSACLTAPDATRRRPGHGR